MQRVFLSHLSLLQQRSRAAEGREEVLIDQFAGASTLEIVVKAVFGSSLEGGRAQAAAQQGEEQGRGLGDGEAGEEERAIEEVMEAFRGVQRAFENGFSIFTLLPLLR